MDEQNTQILQDTPVTETVTINTENFATDNLQNLETPQPNQESTVPDNALGIAESENPLVDESSGRAESPGETQVTDSSAIEGEIVEQKAKMGRPSKYNETMLQKAKDYYLLCKEKRAIPYIEELALQCDVNDETITEWTKLDEDYSATIKNIKNLQKLALTHRGFKMTNPTFAIFLLKVNHGMIESEKRILTGERQGEPVQFTVTDYKGSSNKLPESSQQVIEEGSE